MGEQWFLKVDGIAGEALDERHRGEIEVLAWSLGATAGRGGLLGGVAGRFGGGAGGGSGKVSFDDLSVETRLGSASPPLLGACAAGRRLRSLDLTGVRDDDGRGELATYRFEDATVSGVHHGDALGAEPLDRVSFAYARVRMTYRPQRPDGSLGDPVSTGWDLQRNQPW